MKRVLHQIDSTNVLLLEDPEAMLNELKAPLFQIEAPTNDELLDLKSNANDSTNATKLLLEDVLDDTTAVLHQIDLKQLIQLLLLDQNVLHLDDTTAVLHQIEAPISNTPKTKVINVVNKTTI